MERPPQAPLGNPRPNQIGQPEGGDRKRQRRNAIFPTSEAAAVIVQARTTFLLNSIHNGVEEITISSRYVDEAGSGESAPPAEPIGASSSQAAGSPRRRRHRDRSTDDIIEGPRSASGDRATLVPSHLLGWSSDSEVDLAEAGMSEQDD